MGHKYFIEDGGGNLLAFCKQKIFKLKEDIRIYTDKSMTQELFRIKQENILDFSGTFQVIDSRTERTIGYLKRMGFKSIIKDEWILMDPNKQEIGRVKEDSTGMALLRRYVLSMIPYKYKIYYRGHQIGTYNEKFTLIKDIYDLEINGDPGFNLDRRLLLSIAICLDAIENE